MAISKVQSKSSQNTNVTSAALAFTSNCAAGNLLIYATGAGNGTGITAATDNNTNTIANAKSQAGTSPAGDSRVDYVANSHAGATTGTCHATTSSDMQFHIWEVSGVTTTSPVRDTGSVASSATGSVTTAGSTTASGDAVFAFFEDDPNGDTLTADGSFTWNEFSTKAAADSALSELKQATAGGSQTATVSGNGTDVMSQIIVTFIAASSGLTVGEMVAALELIHDHNLRAVGPIVNQHEVFAGDVSHLFVPIVPVATLAGTQYNEHLDHPNIQGPRFDRQGAEEEQWPNQFTIPSFGWFIEEKSDIPVAPGTATEAEYEERGLRIVLPPFLDGDYDQLLRDVNVGITSDEGERALSIIIPPPPQPQLGWEDDAIQQLLLGQQPTTPQSEEESVLPIILPPFLDGDFDQLLREINAAKTSDEGERGLQIILPPPPIVLGYDDESMSTPQMQTLYEALYDFLDELAQRVAPPGPGSPADGPATRFGFSTRKFR